MITLMYKWWRALTGHTHSEQNTQRQVPFPSPLPRDSDFLLWGGGVWKGEKQCLAHTVLISECSFNGLFGSHCSTALSPCTVNQTPRGLGEGSG